MTGVFFVLSFQKSCDGVTVSEISGQDLSLTTSQTGNNISWLFEVSANVSGCGEGRREGGRERERGREGRREGMWWEEEGGKRECMCSAS